MIAADDDLKVCVMNGGSFNSKNLKGSYTQNIDAFYGQGDFEKIRKSGTAAAYFVTQNKEYHRTVTETYRRYHSYGTLKPELDKGGNDLAETRRALQQRLRAYKTEKRAREARAQDYTADIEEINANFAELKAQIIDVLTSAKTYVDFARLDDVTNYRLSWLVRGIESICTKAARKTFGSTAEANGAISKAKAEIAKLQAKLYSANGAAKQIA